MNLFWTISSVILLGALVLLILTFAIATTWIEVKEGVK